MTLTIAQILDCKPGMEKLLQATVPAATALRIARLAQKITAEHKTAYEEYTKLFERYGTRDSAGNIQVTEARMEEFRQELDPFLATEVNVEVDRIPLEGIEQVAMTAGEIASIEVFLLVGEAGG
jgi:single-stranded DNA-specific DHH superfamily exonuclease